MTDDDDERDERDERDHHLLRRALAELALALVSVGVGALLGALTSSPWLGLVAVAAWLTALGLTLDVSRLGKRAEGRPTSWLTVTWQRPRRPPRPPRDVPPGDDWIAG